MRLDRSSRLSLVRGYQITSLIHSVLSGNLTLLPTCSWLDVVACSAALRQFLSGAHLGHWDPGRIGFASQGEPSPQLLRLSYAHEDRADDSN